MPGQPPSALTRSSAVTGLSGVSGGVSIETLLMNNRPERENHSASFDSRSASVAAGAARHQRGQHKQRQQSFPMKVCVPHDDSEFPNPVDLSGLSDHHFAARPWLRPSARTETADYH